MQDIKYFVGHSGCSVSLVRGEKYFFVRKISKDASYNYRLYKQIEKQILFHHPYIKTPEIIKTGYQNDLYYADMEYVPGISLNKYIQEYQPITSLKIINSILNIETKHRAQINKAALQNKAKEIANKTNDENPHHKKFLLRFIDYYDIPAGYCHGDLSLENVLIYNNDIYLIDFLDAFYDSYLVDVSKIFMDLIYGWSWKNSNDAPFVKNKIILNSLVNRYSKEELEIIKDLISLHLLRIEPYLKNNKDKTFINNCIDHSINNLLL